MNMADASAKIDKFRKALDAVLKRFTEAVTVIGVGEPCGKTFAYYERGLEQLIDKVRDQADLIVEKLGDVYDDFEKDEEDKKFVISDSDATESDYEPSDEEEEYQELDDEDEDDLLDDDIIDHISIDDDE